jgi:AAA15 family ATPase/GTPase
MSEINHLKYFKVENFKCFESLELSDLGQFNLIVGNNNFGKSTLLESLLVSEKVEDIVNHLQHVYVQRFSFLKSPTTNFNFINFFKNVKKIDSPIQFKLKIGSTNAYKDKIISFDTLTFNQLNKDELYILQQKNLPIDPNNIIARLEIDGYDKQLSYIKDSWQKEHYTPIVFYNLGYGKDLVDFYSKSIQISKERKEEFIKDVEIFIPEIEDIELSQTSLPQETSIAIRVKFLDSLIQLPMYGEGANKIFRILSELSLVNNSRLMIDEIDSGIHFSRFKQFWKTILLSAEKNNVQIFATTHSIECLKYLKEALEDLGENFQNKSRHFLLKKTKDNQALARKFDFKQFENAIELGNEIRN